MARVTKKRSLAAGPRKHKRLADVDNNARDGRSEMEKSKDECEFDGTLLGIERCGYDNQKEYYRTVGYTPRDTLGLLNREQKTAFALVEANYFIPLTFHLEKAVFGPLSGTTGELRAIRAARLGLLPPRAAVRAISDVAPDKSSTFAIQKDLVPNAGGTKSIPTDKLLELPKRKRRKSQQQAAGISTAETETYIDNEKDNATEEDTVDGATEEDTVDGNEVDDNEVDDDEVNSNEMDHGKKKPLRRSIRGKKGDAALRSRINIGSSGGTNTGTDTGTGENSAPNGRGKKRKRSGNDEIGEVEEEKGEELAQGKQNGRAKKSRATQGNQRGRKKTPRNQGSAEAAEETNMRMVPSPEMLKASEEPAVLRIVQKQNTPFMVCASCGRTGHWEATCSVKQRRLEQQLH